MRARSGPLAKEVPARLSCQDEMDTSHELLALKLCPSTQTQSSVTGQVPSMPRSQMASYSGLVFGFLVHSAHRPLVLPPLVRESPLRRRSTCQNWEAGEWLVVD